MVEDRIGHVGARGPFTPSHHLFGKDDAIDRVIQRQSHILISKRPPYFGIDIVPQVEVVPVGSGDRIGLYEALRLKNIDLRGGCAVKQIDLPGTEGGER